jgi:aryl-alcohol dehydrogenase-like predicted oxidoreductase
VSAAEPHQFARARFDRPALGLGCWAIGGRYWRDGKPMGWAGGDDAEAVRAIRLAVDLGFTLFDTADVYGCGHSERLLARALRGVRERVVLATKFGRLFEEGERRVTGKIGDADSIRRACEGSLRRLGAERIDLYLFHLASATSAEAEWVAGVLEELIEEGKIGAYGWSTDDAAAAASFSRRPGCAALEHELNVFEPADAMVRLCEAGDLVGIARSPLGTGLLGGRVDAATVFPDDDVRSHELDPRLEPQRRRLRDLEEIGHLLRDGGRTFAQGAIAWVWARSRRAVPIPGGRTSAQVRENAKALEQGPLEPETVAAIERVLGRARSASSAPR